MNPRMIRYALLSLMVGSTAACASLSTTTTATYIKPIGSTVASMPAVQPNHPLYDAQWPSNINYWDNKIEFATPQKLGKLYKKWHSGKLESISIAHFGDSHIQTGWQVSAIRNTLQQAYVAGGRGMIFPYAIAKTYSQEDYTSSFTGQWKTSNSIHQPPRIPLGISGFVATTTNTNSSFSFDFSKRNDNLGNIKATVYLKAVDGSYQITARNGQHSQTKTVNAKTGNPTQSITFDLPNTAKKLDFTVTKQSVGTATFELHGVNLDNAESTGLTYHNLGVGGANYKSIVQQKLFDEQFTGFPADLVVLDWGTNDILYTNALPSDIESTIRRTIQKVRSANPEAVILLTSAQEARYKGRPVTVSAEFSNLVRRIAQDEGVLFYDWYRISGGGDSVNTWREAGYASKDNIHLNGKGYRIRGRMLAEALLEALRKQ